MLLATLLITIFLAMAPMPVYAQRPPQITVTPTSGVIGSRVTIRGTDFPYKSPYESKVDIGIDSIYLIKGIETNNGTFEVYVEIPVLPAGEKTVTATAWFMDNMPLGVTSSFTVLPPKTTIPPPPTQIPPPSVPLREIPPWFWSIPTVIIAGAVGYSLKRWIDTRRIKVRLYKDNTGTQQIEPGTPIYFDSEIGLRPVLDTGQQSIETENSSDINE